MNFNKKYLFIFTNNEKLVNILGKNIKINVNVKKLKNN